MRLDLAAEELRKKMGPYETEVISQRRIINNRDVTDRAMLRTVAKQPVRPELARSRLVRSADCPVLRGAPPRDQRAGGVI
jgi:hypothetical protein